MTNDDPTGDLSSAPEIMHVRKVAEDWSKENSVPWTDLEDGILDAAFGGEFEELFTRDKRLALHFTDPETGERQPYAGPDLARRLVAAASDAELVYYYFIRAAKEARLYGIHRDAVLLFADRRGLAAPSWWKPA